MKRLEFVGSSLDDLREFPAEARRAAGFELGFVQRGLDFGMARALCGQVR